MRPLATIVNTEVKRTLAKALAALTIGLSFASAGQAATVAELANEVFVSETAAVSAAANRYNPQSIAQDKEFMGAIYQCEEGHRYSVGAGKAGAGNVTVSLRTPQGCKTVALWHTHGAEHRSHKYFSDIDTRLVEQVGLPFYMADYTGSLRVFEPGDRTMTYSEARRLGLGSSNQFARGSLVTDPAGETLAVATHSHGQHAVALNH